MTLRITRERARHLAIMAQLLDRERPADIMDVVTRLGRVQMDPTAVVARTEHLVLYSRLGRYERAELERLMWRERRLVEYWAFLVPTADLPLHRPTMGRALDRDSAQGRRMRRWMADNADFRRRVMRDLGRRGPLRTRELDDDPGAGERSGVWGGRNVTRMLDALWAMGEVAVVGRAGQERVWGLAKDWYPGPAGRVSPAAVAREILARQLAAKGVARITEFGRAFDGRPPGWERALAELMREGLVRETRVEGLRGDFYGWAPLLERPFRGRSAVLSPFDRLIHDRRRSLELFDLDYRLEIYVPPAERRWGYYVTPVLDGDRFIARFDARRDPENGRLRVLALHAEPGASSDAAAIVAREVKALARWLGLREVEYLRVPRGWRRELER